MVVQISHVTPAVVAMLGRAMSEGMREQAAGGHRQHLDADRFGWQVERTLVSVARLSTVGVRGELSHIGTDPAHERRGYAGALVTAVMEHLGLAVLIADTDDEAVGFYRRAGSSVEPLESRWTTPR